MSNHTRRMLETHSNGAAVDPNTLVEFIQACFDCEQSCTACADACIGEGDVQMLARCIRLCLDCADVCDATGKIMSRQTAFEAQRARAALEACTRACRICRDECEQHADYHEHCRVCAAVCRHCKSACNNALSAVGG